MDNLCCIGRDKGENENIEAKAERIVKVSDN